MTDLIREPRRPNLATIVGSGLAVVAAGSLLAFSSLAEQAGLEGLATGGLQPAQPARGGKGHVITVPAPAPAEPADPREGLAELVRDSVARRDVVEPEVVRIVFTPEPRPERPEKPARPDPIESTARVAVAEPEVTEEPEYDGPPYGHAYGHYKNRDEKAKPKPKKHDPKPAASDAPVYARKAEDGKAKGPKPPKLKKVEKAEPRGKAKGHSKHAHAKGKGKGHSKHGH